MKERPDLDDYHDEIHHPNGNIEDRWRHNEYVEDLNKYIDHLQSELEKVIAMLNWAFDQIDEDEVEDYDTFDKLNEYLVTNKKLR